MVLGPETSGAAAVDGATSGMASPGWSPQAIRRPSSARSVGGPGRGRPVRRTCCGSRTEADP